LGVRLITSHRKTYHCYETQKKPRSGATFKGDQDPYRVVEPMTMMMMIAVLIDVNSFTNQVTAFIEIETEAEPLLPYGCQGEEEE
jgi:hypothetical protein